MNHFAFCLSPVIVSNSQSGYNKAKHFKIRVFNQIFFFFSEILVSPKLSLILEIDTRKTSVENFGLSCNLASLVQPGFLSLCHLMFHELKSLRFPNPE